jgi:CheY-like chemotaxis protein
MSARSTQLPVILIVDDDPDILALLNLFMHQLAPTFDIVTASDAHGALRHLAQRTVPLLITDYLMPGMDGLQLTAAVKAASP